MFVYIEMCKIQYNINDDVSIGQQVQDQKHGNMIESTISTDQDIVIIQNVDEVKQNTEQKIDTEIEEDIEVTQMEQKQTKLMKKWFTNCNTNFNDQYTQRRMEITKLINILIDAPDRYNDTVSLMETLKVLDDDFKEMQQKLDEFNETYL